MGSNHSRPGGSSPLTRGALRLPLQRQHLRGPIPAHAGSTTPRNWRTGTPRAHPRSRGEHQYGRWWRGGFSGSSPLTRGAPTTRTVQPGHQGLIPAHAGSTPPSPQHCPGPRAHPRSRGEHSLTDDGPSRIDGSSPLTRGAQLMAIRPPRGLGLIPAHAGSTCSPHPTACRTAAHPRSRGEHLITSLEHEARWGSSPLTRGALNRAGQNTTAPGLIPAHAGSTGGWSCVSATMGAHPRSRGEHKPDMAPEQSPQGSSPLTRGAR